MKIISIVENLQSAILFFDFQQNDVKKTIDQFCKLYCCENVRIFLAIYMIQWGKSAVLFDNSMHFKCVQMDKRVNNLEFYCFVFIVNLFFLIFIFPRSEAHSRHLDSQQINVNQMFSCAWYEVFAYFDL